jgi:uncharacterized protein YbjT (DUF2867 family)
MKIVIIGGSARIGSRVVARLREQGHEAIPASPESGVDTLTGKGLARALDGAAVVVDVSNSPSWDDAAVLHFFETSTTNLLKAESAAGVGHHVALSVVGTDRLLGSGYFRAKLAQETLIRASTVPYTIVRATQFYEFIGSIADTATEGNLVRLPPVLIQPMAAADVASAVASVAAGAPVNGMVEVAGPQQFRLDYLVRRQLRARHDPREVITDPEAPSWGIAGVTERSLVPDGEARLGQLRFEQWLDGTAERPVVAPSPVQPSAGVAAAPVASR